MEELPDMDKVKVEVKNGITRVFVGDKEISDFVESIEFGKIEYDSLPSIKITILAPELDLDFPKELTEITESSEPREL